MTFLNSIAARFMTGAINVMLNGGYKRSIAKAKSQAAQNENEKARITKWRNIYGVTQIPWTLEYDFLKYRSPSYLRNTKRVYATYFRLLFGLEQNPKKVSSPSDEHFYRIVSNTGNSFYLRPTGKPGIYYLDLTQLMNVEVFAGYFYEVRGLEVDSNTKEIAIVTRHNRRVQKGDSNYEQAKIHATTCLCYFNVGIAHSWVHFQFPCVVSAVVFNEVPRDSVLYKILYVHTRFTMRINHQALRIKRASDNKQIKSKRFNAVQTFPMTANTFLENNQARTVDFYKVDGEFSAPPQLNEQLPYHRFVGAYYRVIRQFIEDLGSRLEIDLVEKLFAEVGKYIPARLSVFEPKDLLATFIWQVSILHSSDHHTYSELFQNYSCPMLGHRLEEGEPSKSEEMFDDINVAKFRNFIDVFVRFSFDEEFPNNFDHLTYNFTDSDLQALERDFFAKLKAVESGFVKEDLNLTPLRQIAQSICF